MCAIRAYRTRVASLEQAAGWIGSAALLGGACFGTLAGEEEAADAGSGPGGSLRAEGGKLAAIGPRSRPGAVGCHTWRGEAGVCGEGVAAQITQIVSGQVIMRQWRRERHFKSPKRVQNGPQKPVSHKCPTHKPHL